jgi:hypothetical protein
MERDDRRTVSAPTRSVAATDPRSERRSLPQSTRRSKCRKEKLGDALGVTAGAVKGDLQRFKELVESSEQEPGAWRADIPPAG